MNRALTVMAAVRETMGADVRVRFHADLAQVSDILVQMADGATVAMQRATAALLSADDDLARQVVCEDAGIDGLYRRMTEQVGELLARQSPVAGDLRLTITALQVGGELERMGDLAVHVARIARRRAPEVAVVPELRDLIRSMADRAVQMGAKVTTVLRTADAEAAAELSVDDDAIDALHRQLFEVLLDKSWSHGVAPAIDAAQLGRWYERFADHAVNAGRREIYFVTGRER
jgi:phosphate transport system protein